MGIFEKMKGEFVLTEYFPIKGLGKEEIIEKIRNMTGWKLKVSEDLKEAEEPKAEEVMMLRYFDPDRNFLTD